jgi:hypothetical protein
MFVYQATKGEFIDHVVNDTITNRIIQAFEERVHRVNLGEVRSWQNSMQFMHKVLHTPEIPDEYGVAIEFTVPYAGGKRIDFLCRPMLVIWLEMETSNNDALMEVRFLHVSKGREAKILAAVASEAHDRPDFRDIPRRNHVPEFLSFCTSGPGGCRQWMGGDMPDFTYLGYTLDTRYTANAFVASVSVTF